MSLCSILEQCGGCPRMSESLDQQRSRRIKQVRERLGVRVSGIIESPKTEGYRARIELTPGPDGQLGYRGHRSHLPVPVTHCPIARPEINEILPKIGPVPGFIQRIALRSNGQSVVLHARCKDKSRNKATAWLNGLKYLQIPMALNGRGVHLDPTTSIEVMGVTHHFSPATFYQVNLEINELLVGDVIQEAMHHSPTSVLDLFSGAGNFSLPLARKNVDVTLIEAHPTATKDARRTANRLGINADIRTANAEAYQAGDAFFEVAILDPPRKGAGAVVEQVLLTRPRAVILISCNPHTLANDLKTARKHGYSMSEVRLYEMFPHTDHVEAMGVLVR